MKSLLVTYLVTGFGICLGFGAAAYFGWRLPGFDNSFGSNSFIGRSSGSSSYIGRSTGGSWGGGK